MKTHSTSTQKEIYSELENQRWSHKDMLNRLFEINLLLHKPESRRDVALFMEQQRLLEDLGIILMPVP